MTCPACADTRHRVVDSRPAGADGIMRRRLCRTCGLRWTTVETAAAFAGTPVRPLQRWLAEMTAATTAVEQALAKVAAVLNNRPLLDARTHPFADVPPSTVVKRLKRRVHP